MKKFLLLLILTLAFVLRFYKLDTLPALNADEAAIGYNAYSLIETGKDEHGNPWPIHFQSFNDWKPGLYFYLVLPLVKIFGLNVWSVRVPGAFLGVLTVYVIYLLVKELQKNHKSPFTSHSSLPIVASFFLAISPWHIHFSRGGWEVNTATFFLAAAVLFFLKASPKPRFYFISFFLFVASLYTYHATRLISPLLGLSLLIIYRREVLKSVKFFGVAVCLAILFTIPLVADLSGPAGVSRAAGVGLFADPGPLSRVNEQRGQHEQFDGFFAKTYHNKVVNYGLAFVENWLSHYWGEFLFLSGDEIERNRVPETGQMYLYDVIFLSLGLVFILKKPKGWEVVIFWFGVAPVAASLTFQSPHALRAQNMIIPLTIISAMGLVGTIDFLSKRVNSRLLLFTVYCGLITIVAWSALRYLHMYYTHMAKEYRFSSQYGVAELAEFVKENESKHPKILITDRYDQPYILMLFYLKYPPAVFQKEHELTARDQYGFSTVRRFGKFQFTSIDYDRTGPENPNSLLIGTDEEIPKEANIVKKVYGSNGHLYFEAVSN